MILFIINNSLFDKKRAKLQKKSHMCKKNLHISIIFRNFAAKLNNLLRLTLPMKPSKETFAPLWELNPLWEALTEQERQFIADNVEAVQYSKHEIIHHDGDESNYVWMLLKGTVRIYKEGIGQRQQIIRLLKPYDIFGYRACIAKEPYNSSASILESATVYRLKREHFIELVRNNGAFCYQVTRMMAKDLAISEIQTVNLTQKHIRGRLAESLLLLKKNYGFEEDGTTIAMLLPREDLANMSNMTTSNAIRTLSQFAQEGIIALNGKRIQVLNEKELEHISRLG